jgi:hypothetical protein
MNSPVAARTAPVERTRDELLCTVAHEIRQPLGAIASIAYYLAMISPEDASIQEQVTQIQQLVEKANWILANGLQLMDAPAGTPALVDLAELITEALATRPPLETPPVLELGEQPMLVRSDPAQARALVRNLVALIAAIATPAHPATIRLCAVPGGTMFDLETGAPGHRAEASLCSGSTLALDAARRVAELYGGRVDCEVDSNCGVRLRVMLP